MKYQVGKTGRIVLARFEDREDALKSIADIAIGAVISFASIRSTFAFINSPGETSSLFECTARIFSVIVISHLFVYKKAFNYKSNLEIQYYT